MQFILGLQVGNDLRTVGRHAVSHRIPVAAEMLHKIALFGNWKFQPDRLRVRTQAVNNGSPIAVLLFGEADVAANGFEQPRDPGLRQQFLFELWINKSQPVNGREETARREEEYLPNMFTMIKAQDRIYRR